MPAGRAGTAAARSAGGAGSGEHLAAALSEEDGELSGGTVAMALAAGNRRVRIFHRTQRFEAAAAIQTGIFVDRHSPSQCSAGYSTARGEALQGLAGWRLGLRAWSAILRAGDRELIEVAGDSDRREDRLRLLEHLARPVAPREMREVEVADAGA